MMPPDIFSYITTEESKFETDEIQVGDNWFWNFRNHVQLIFHLKNGVFFNGENKYLRAFKGVMEPLLNLCFWVRDIDVKDVVFFSTSEKGRISSFLYKKYHDEVYSKEHDLDKLFDDIVESDSTFGGVLVQQTGDGVPEATELNSIAFCDQTDLLGGVVAFKFNFSPNKLRKMSKVGWGDEKNGANISIEDLIVLATAENEIAGSNGKKNQTTGKSIEVYILRGSMPEHYLKDNNDMEYHCDQIQIVARYTKKDGKKEGVILYRKKETDENLLFFSSNPVYMRALGRGPGEILIHPQIWENFLTIHKMQMIEAGSKSPLWTDDDSFTNSGAIIEQENLTVNKLSEGRRIGLIETLNPNNFQAISGSINEWYQQAQLGVSAFDPQLGKQESAGTTFRGQERLVQQGKGSHERAKGKIGKFIEEIYRKMILPDMRKGILKGKKFLAELTMDEMNWVIETLATNYANLNRNEAVLNGEIPQEFDVLKQEFLNKISKKGNTFLIEILEEELADEEIEIGINVAGKQKDLFGLSDRLLSIFQFVFTNPQGFQQAMQNPALAKSFNDILEFGGLNPVDFSTLISAPIAPAPQQTPQIPQAQSGQLLTPQATL